jgi:hypothetical protein
MKHSTTGHEEPSDQEGRIPIRNSAEKGLVQTFPRKDLEV